MILQHFLFLQKVAVLRCVLTFASWLTKWRRKHSKLGCWRYGGSELWISRTTRRLLTFAINLQQEHPHLCGLLVYHVSALPTDKFYYQTRWPNWYGVQHAVPADCFDESTARKASDDAKAIIDMIKLIV